MERLQIFAIFLLLAFSFAVVAWTLIQSTPSNNLPSSTMLIQTRDIFPIIGPATANSPK